MDDDDQWWEHHGEALLSRDHERVGGPPEAFTSLRDPSIEGVSHEAVARGEEPRQDGVTSDERVTVDLTTLAETVRPPARTMTRVQQEGAFSGLIVETLQETVAWGDCDPEDDEAMYAVLRRVEMGASGGAGETMTTAPEQVKAQARVKSTLKTRTSTLLGKRARQNASSSAGPAPKDMHAPDPAPEDMCAPCFPIENERRPCRKQRQCESANCTKRRVFALDGQRARHCKTHAEEDEVDVNSKRCESANCTKQPSFALVGQPARHCKTHAEEDEVDVANKRCESANCTTKPVFALDGQPARHCKTHAEEDEVDVVSKRCESANCTKQPKFALVGQPARHCKTHAESGEVDVVSKRCQGCEKDIDVSTAANPKYTVVGNDQTVEHLCAACFHRKYPTGAFDGDERVGGRIHSREGTCVNAVLNAEGLKDLPWTWDRPFWFGCWEGCDSKRRVDIWVLIGACVLGVEIDENQHRGKHYAADAEVRTNEIAMEIGAAPFYLVRFNPDSYVTKSGKNIKGFYEVKKGKTTRNKPEINRRLATLIQTLEKKRNELEKLSREKSTLVEAYLVETFLFFDGYAD